MIHNRLDKIFGLEGAVLGYLLIFVGFFFSHTISQLFILISGSLMAFSYSAIKIDRIHQKYKLYYALFGVIKIGKWKSLDDIKGIAGISPLINRWNYHCINNPIDYQSEKCFVVFFSKKSQRRIPFKKCKDLLEAKFEAQKFAQDLHLEMIR